MNNSPSTWRNSGNIIVPGRFVEAHEIELPKPKVFGRIRLQKFNRYGTLIAENEFDNLITNLGLDSAALGGANWPSCLKVGTGTAAPSFTDTTLGAQVASTTTRASEVAANASALNQPATTTNTYTFALGAINANLTEVGIGDTNTSCHARALIVDQNGNPTSFPVSSDEQLKVSYIRGHYGPQADIVTTQSLSGTSYNVTIRAYNVKADDHPFGLQGGSVGYMRLSSQTTLPAYGGSVTLTGGANSTSCSNSTYGSGTHYMDFSGTWAAGNGTGTFPMLDIMLQGMELAVLYSPSIVKGATQSLTLPFRVSWDRY